MIDMDDFKAINDNHGHQTGDAVLVDAVATFKAECRTVDIIGRYGGEEFLILLPDTGVDAATILAKRVCASIANNLVQASDGATIRYTCSIGVAEYIDGQSKAEWLNAADDALYLAKSQGKNRAVVAPNPDSA